MSIHGYVGNIITANPTAPTVTSASGVWTTEQQLAAVSAGNWPGYEYPISRSLRFNSADSAYLNRTCGTPTDNAKFTWSCWVKRTTLGTDQIVIGGYENSTNRGAVIFTSSDNLLVYRMVSSSGVNLRVTNAVFRDVSAWYHVVVVFDSNNATVANRVRVYVNGIEQTYSTSNDPGSGSGMYINRSATLNTIGQNGGSAGYLNGYMTEVNFIDGQALTPSSFGLNDPETGVWSPKQYKGTYGTNGFYLNFSDNSNTTAATLGKDYSGNGNNWTPNLFSVTAGAGNDSLVDSPTAYGTDTGVGGEVRGNYATLNPLKRFTANLNLSNGNLTASDGSTTSTCAIATINLPTSGKWYWEVTVSASVASSIFIGACPEANAYGTAVVQTNGSYRNNGTIYNTASATQTSGATYTTNDVIGVAVDVDNGTVQFYKNGVVQGATPSFSFTALSVLVPFVATDNASGTKTVNCNFGQTSFLKWNGSAFVANTAPSGFKALCTQNLTYTHTIGATSTTQAGKYFNPVLYTGTGSTRTVTGVGFQPDFTWIKPRSSADHHILYDAIRGVRKQIYTNLTNAEETETQGLSAFTSDGFTVNGAHTVRGQTNDNTVTYVAWNWNAGGSNATNTSGTITSTVRANTTSGFSIATYTGTGANATVGHGCQVGGVATAPDMVIVKGRNTINLDWVVYHKSLTSAAYALFLNATNAQTLGTTYWNSTAPTSTVFSVGADNNTNKSATTYVAYCFAEVPGYSIFGSYASNNSADNAFVYCGFRPRWIMIKSSTTGGTNYDWLIFDTARMSYNYIANTDLRANLTTTEGGTARNPPLDILSNGFKVRGSGGEIGSSTTYIFAAFAETPFKYALAR
jgi:hypothetical protein